MDEAIKILFIDDVQFVLETTRRRLLTAGFDVKTANNGRAGLKIWKEWAPDVVLLDLVMPEMSGWEILEDARTEPQCKQTPVVIYSEQDSSSARQKARDKGIHAVMSKCADFQDLAHVLRVAAIDGDSEVA